MTVNRMIKWSAAGLLAVASVPAVSLAHSMRASLPADLVSMTPAGPASPLAATPVSSTTHSRHKTAHHHKKTAAHGRKHAKHHRKAGHHARHKSGKSSKHA